MDIEQRTDEWFAVRLGKATASRFGDILASVRYGEAAARKNYRTQLVLERLTGQREDTFTSSAMQWGIDNEPIAKDAYIAETGSDVDEASFVEHELLAAGASPDGYVDTLGLLEIKCPNSATHIETLRTGTIPKYYYPQVQGQMWITGKTWCDFVSFDPRMPDGAQLFITRVARDDEYIQRLSNEVAGFLEEVDEELAFLEGYKHEAISSTSHS